MVHVYVVESALPDSWQRALLEAKENWLGKAIFEGVHIGRDQDGLYIEQGELENGLPKVIETEKLEVWRVTFHHYWEGIHILENGRYELLSAVGVVKRESHGKEMWQKVTIRGATYDDVDAMYRGITDRTLHPKPTYDESYHPLTRPKQTIWQRLHLAR